MSVNISLAPDVQPYFKETSGLPNTEANPPLTPGNLHTDAASTERPVKEPAATSLRVEISTEGRERLKAEKLEAEKYADIDRAPLPEDVKEILKNIRKLQEKIAKASEELTEVMSDLSLSDEERKREQLKLTAQLQSLQSALGDATSALNNAMSMHNLVAESRSLAKGLVGMK